MSDVVIQPTGWFRRVLSGIGIVVVGWNTVGRYVHGEIPLWVLLCVGVAELGWLAFAYLPDRLARASIFYLGLMVAGGALAAAATDAVAVVPVGVALLWMARDLRHPISRPIVVGIAAMILALVGAVLAPVTPLELLALEAAIVVSFLSGQSRRQFLVAEGQARQLVGEQARADILAARQQIAHDIHDVLAHSLGGLVIQLDAVDALLEAGDTAGAAARVRDSRALAAEGLGEARRAVAALSERPDPSDAVVASDELARDIAALLEAHRSLGGVVSLAEAGEPRPIPESLEIALRRAVQEGLTNARKHAPGERASVDVSWGDAEVTITITNRLARGSANSSGGGHGLVGMRERFALLPGGSATATVEADRFVVSVRGATE
jgi:signal transduction histidine kinase